jgi:hypothetical protein
VLESAGLEDMVEEIFPFTAEFSHNLITIIDAEDLVGTPYWSNETLVERYYKSQGKTYQRKLSKKEQEALAAANLKKAQEAQAVAKKRQEEEAALKAAQAEKDALEKKKQQAAEEERR